MDSQTSNIQGHPPQTDVLLEARPEATNSLPARPTSNIQKGTRKKTYTPDLGVALDEEGDEEDHRDEQAEDHGKEGPERHVEASRRVRSTRRHFTARGLSLHGPSYFLSTCGASGVLVLHVLMM